MVLGQLCFLSLFSVHSFSVLAPSFFAGGYCLIRGKGWTAWRRTTPNSTRSTAHNTEHERVKQ